MLETLTLRNFQYHRKYTLEFDPLLTCVVGPSDRGKSALLRALRWLAANRPSGDAFLRRGAKGVSVTLAVDGKNVVRSKGKSNAYKLDGKVYAAFGQSVPEPVASLLDLSPENFQGQHDAPFWFALSPGEVSKELNRIVNLELIDCTLKNLASGLRAAKSASDLTRTRLRDAKTARNRLRWAEAADRSLKRLESSEEEISRLKRSCVILEGVVEDVERTRTITEQLSTTASAAGADVETVEASVKIVIEQHEEYQSLNRLVEQIQHQEEELCRYRKSATAASADLTRRLRGKCPACGRSLPPSPSSVPTST